MKYILIALDRLIAFIITIIFGVVALITTVIMYTIAFFWEFKTYTELDDFWWEIITALEESIQFKQSFIEHVDKALEKVLSDE